MKIKVFVALLIVFGLSLIAIHARVSAVSVPPVEVNALFKSADSDKDGMISKEEFEKYLVRMKTKPAPQENIRICPNSGAPCSGDGLCSSGSGDMCCGGVSDADCCSAKAVQPSPKVTAQAQPQGGCCKDKAGAEKKEGGCCSDKDKVEKTL